MLKGIHPLLTADLLHALSSMGHSDELAIVDRNFPAAALARRCIALPGHGTGVVAEAVFSVFPVDTFVDEPILRMQVVGSPDEIPGVQSEFVEIAQSAEGRPIAMGSLPRGEFYERARRAFVIVLTGETRGYGDFIVTKGGVRDEAR